MTSEDKNMNSLDREAAVLFLNKELDEPKKIQRRTSWKRTLCIVLLVLAVFACIFCLAIFFCVADVTRPVRCYVSPVFNLDLKECREKGVLDSLAEAPSSNSLYTNASFSYNITKSVTSCNESENTNKDCSSAVVKRLSERDVEYIKEAEKSWKIAWEILNDKKDWLLEKGKDLDTGRVYYKEYENFGKVNKLEGYVYTTPETLFKVLITDAQDYPTWNPIIAEAYVVEAITDNIDISYMQTNPVLGGLISSREYLNIRMWQTVDGSIMSSGAGVEHPDQPITDDIVRAYNRPGGMLFRPVKGEPNKCLLVWTLSADFGGWVPSWAVNSGVPSSMIDFLNDARERVQQL